jgi:uncharacterized protein (TIGR03437 family)
LASVLASILTALPAVTQADQAQTLTTLYNFCAQANCADGQNPSGILLETPDGSFYGTASGGGIGYRVAEDSAGYGLIFKISPAGALTVVHVFNGTDGATPATGVIASGGNLYGTFNGFAPEANIGASIPGGIFELTPSGTLSILKSLVESSSLTLQGWSPISGLTIGPDGGLYGAIQNPSIGACTANCGYVFRMTPTGDLRTIFVFNGQDTDAGYSALTLGLDGNFYGTAWSGGIYRLTPAGGFTLLYTFGTPDGATSAPVGGLALGPDGNFYGMTEYGGTSPNSGNVFRITPSGTLAALSDVNGSAPAAAYYIAPNATLVLGPDGNFYGVMEYGGACPSYLDGCGTIFRISPSGNFATLYTFSGSDGRQPVTGLTLGSDGNFYGTTYWGGPNDAGTIFRLTIPHTAPSVAANGVLNAASFTAPVAPGSIVSLFGTFAIPMPVSANSYPPPTVLSGLSVQFGSAPLAPLFYASQSQLNAQIPWELAGQSKAALTVSQYGQSSTSQTVPLAPYAPAIFVMDQATQEGAILDIDYKLVGPSNPTTAGAYIQLYCTGLGPVTNQPATGAPALADPLSWTTATPTVSIGGIPATPIFSGLAPGDVGLYQVNVQVPAGLAKGSAVPVAISLSGVASNTVTMAIR